ncbi:MAG: hypothetical protein LBT21_00710 [Oscillospiraceae bacterium]|jgi:hypothetical protein|nr:hypothetical protein [Oscillospiraceae bacterium]
MAKLDSKERFSDRAANYARFRPTYPPAAIDCITPLAGHPNHAVLKAALQDLFAQYNENSSVRFEYKTEVLIGKL